MASRNVPVRPRTLNNARFRKIARTMIRSGRIEACIRGSKSSGYIVAAICTARTVRAPGSGNQTYTKPGNGVGLCDLSEPFGSKPEAAAWLSDKMHARPVNVPVGKQKIVQVATVADAA